MTFEGLHNTQVEHSDYNKSLSFNPEDDNNNDNLLKKRSYTELNELQREIETLKMQLQLKTSECNTYMKKFENAPSDLEQLRNFPEFVNGTVQNKYLQLKARVLEEEQIYVKKDTNPNINRTAKCGPFYYVDEGCVYEGQYKNQKRDGWGKCIYKNGSFYHGFWQNDLFQGFGLFIKKSGEYILGEYNKGSIHGQAERVFSDGNVYSGGYFNNKPHGYGKEILVNGTVYEGQFVNGKKTGIGKIFYNMEDTNTNKTYEGDVHDGKINGEGKMVWEDGKVYEGLWTDGRPCGKGKFQWKNGTVYEGEYNKDGYKHGKGVLNIPSAGMEYEGEFKNGKINGVGKVTYSDGRVSTGTWKDGL